MKIQPKESYQLLGTNLTLTTGKTYLAEKAINIPDYEKSGLVFCNGILLDNTEYTVVKS